MVDSDTFKLEYFPFSLEEKIREWFYDLPDKNKISWNNCKAAFILKFNHHEINLDN